jgi:hypothetical protein
MSNSFLLFLLKLYRELVQFAAGFWGEHIEATWPSTAKGYQAESNGIMNFYACQPCATICKQKNQKRCAECAALHKYVKGRHQRYNKDPDACKWSQLPTIPQNTIKVQMSMLQLILQDFEANSLRIQVDSKETKSNK